MERLIDYLDTLRLEVKHHFNYQVVKTTSLCLPTIIENLQNFIRDRDNSKMKHRTVGLNSSHFNSPHLMHIYRVVSENAVNNRSLDYFLHRHPGYIEFYQQLIKFSLNYLSKEHYPVNSYFMPLKIRRRLLRAYNNQRSYQISIDVKNKANINTNTSDKFILNLHIRDCCLTPTGDLEIIQTITLSCFTLLWSYREILDRFNQSADFDSRVINIYYYPTKFKKQLDVGVGVGLDGGEVEMARILGQYIARSNVLMNAQRETILGAVTPAEVNGAYCYRDSVKRHRYIVIFRKEELAKTVVHELIHYFGLEVCVVPDLTSAKYFNLPVSQVFPVYPGELVTELQTWPLYLLLLSIDRYFSYSKANLKTVIYDELQYGRQLVDNILQANATNFKDFMNGQKLLNFNSNFIYYYLFKTLLISNLEYVSSDGDGVGDGDGGSSSSDDSGVKVKAKAKAKDGQSVVSKDINNLLSLMFPNMLHRQNYRLDCGHLYRLLNNSVKCWSNNTQQHYYSDIAVGVGIGLKMNKYL